MKSTLDLLKYPVFVRLALLPALLSALPLQALAAVTDVANAPFTVAGANPAKPNLMFILDDSGSMGWAHMPDDVSTFRGKYGYVSAQCNGVYYDPTITYPLPKNANGSSFPAINFNAAPHNGFQLSATDPTSGLTVVNLATNFRAWDATTGNAGSASAAGAAYYYAYSGTQTVKNYTSTSSTFYKECNSNFGSSPGSTKFTLVNVALGTAAQKQNFANWYSYYRTRMLTMKSAAGSAFAPLNDSLRVGLTTINYTGTNNTNSEFLEISDFNQPQKDTWFSRVYGTTPGSSTPLRAALSKVGRIYAGKIGTDPLQYWCQRNYAILSTDGYWNTGSESSSYGPFKTNGTSNVGNQDGGTTAKPQYEGPTANSNSLADVAAYYYNTDLRPGPACATGVAGADVCQNGLDPKGKDTAPHQHMTTYAIGLGVSGQLKYQEDYETASSGDFYDIKQGTKNWPTPVADTPTAVDDLWHAAVNGRGVYYSARNPTTLANGLGKALLDLQSVQGAGAAASTSNLEPVVGDNYAFTANYRTVFWDGDLLARSIDLATGEISAATLWSAKALLGGRVSALSDTRKIHRFDGSLPTKLKDFVPGNFTAGEKTAWFNPTSLPQYPALTGAQQANATSDRLINYLRGQHGYEMQSDVVVDNQVFRDREFVLGDIVSAKPVYVRIPPFAYEDTGFAAFTASAAIQSRKGVVYVGANDGMLHAFEGTTGQELWAYVPSLVLPNIAKLANRDYGTNHRFSVDGSPTAAEIYDGSQWKSILVGGLGAGGRGYYALDVTDPNNPRGLWEFTDPNLGLTAGNPLVGKLKDGTWAVIFSSGYNNVTPGDGVGRIYILNANTGALIRTISTGVGSLATPSGLSKLSGWVDQGMTDNTIQRVYGGDLLGNMWRFDINDTILPAGYEALKLGVFKIGATAQPITSRPDLGLVNVGGATYNVVYFGTGRLLGISDLTDINQQSIYAIKDSLSAAGIGDARGAPTCPLVKQDIVVQSASTRSISTNAVDWNTKCGWYMDFNPDNETPGERVNVDVKLQVGGLAVATNVPNPDACLAGGTSWLYLLDYRTGSYVSTEVGQSAGRLLGNALVVGISTYQLPNGKVVTDATMANDTHKVTGHASGGGMGIGGGGKRVSWRELFAR